jgi:WD40-like Beta Propeller Repeat
VASFDRVSAERRRFPALDPEPPPPPWWRRLVIPAAVLVLAAAVVAVLQFRPFWPAARGAAGAAGHSAALAGLAGRIVVVTAAGGLALSDPDGGHVTRAMANVGAMVAAAPGNRSLSLFNGQVIVVKRGPALALGHSSVPLSSETTTAWPDPFADHERALVMLQDFGVQSQSSGNPISAVSLATGQAVSLGAGDLVAGDPQAPGAFVSVAAPPSPTTVTAPGSANSDSEIVLRDAGRPPVLLATAAALNSDLGYAPSLPASLDPVPSPSGSEVAVAVRPQGASVTGIVVLSRAGHMLGRALTPVGTQSIPAWSPSGRSLAYLAGVDGGGGPELRIWTIGRSAVVTVPPPSGLAGVSRGYGTCIWSPDGTSILCGAGAGGSGSGGWAIAKAAGGRMTAVPGPGVPVAWLPAPGGR